MTAAEVWFLRAEAALRGWTDEDAERCYRNGVAASFAQWQLSGAESYLGSDAMAADYHDPVDPGNDIAARCRVSPRWDAAADAELKLERIITQKWIAMYPEGCEAWAEQRRTGYPRLFPVRLNHSKGYIDTETMIRRLPFPAVLATSDPEQYAALVAELGGEDHGDAPVVGRGAQFLIGSPGLFCPGVASCGGCQNFSLRPAGYCAGGWHSGRSPSLLRRRSYRHIFHGRKGLRRSP